MAGGRRTRVQRRQSARHGLVHPAPLLGAQILQAQNQQETECQQAQA